MSLGIQTPRLFHLLCAKRRRRISSAVNGFDFVDKVRQRVLRQATRVSPSRGSLCAPPRDAAKSPTTSPSGTLRRANRTGRRSLPSCKQPLSRPKRTYPRRVTTVQVVSLRRCHPRAPPDLGQHPPATPRAREEAVRSYRLAVTSRQHT
jgi:hypothetical protein